MAPKPKIHTHTHIKILRDCYINKKMSTNDISKQSQSLFGQYVSNGTIYKELIRNDVPMRGKSESVSLVKSKIDGDISHINETMVEWADGFLLGDGGINFNRKTIKKSVLQKARFTMGVKHKEWLMYAMSKFRCYGFSEDKIRESIYPLEDTKHPNPMYSTKTYAHPDIGKQVHR